MDNEFRRVQCSVSFCPSGRNYAVLTAPPTWTCLRHQNVNLVDSIVIGDPETGDDATLYSGVEYAVTFRTARMKGKFVARFSGEQTHSWKATFVGDGFNNTFDISLDAITSIVAV